MTAELHTAIGETVKLRDVHNSVTVNAAGHYATATGPKVNCYIHCP